MESRAKAHRAWAIWALVVSMAAAASTGCPRRGTISNTGETIDRAVDRAGDTAGDAVDRAGDTVEDVGDTIENAIP